MRFSTSPQGGGCKSCYSAGKEARGLGASMKRTVQIARLLLSLAAIATIGLPTWKMITTARADGLANIPFAYSLNVIAALLFVLVARSLSFILQFLLSLSQATNLAESLHQNRIEFHLPRIPSWQLIAFEVLLVVVVIERIAILAVFGPDPSTGPLFAWLREAPIRTVIDILQLSLALALAVALELVRRIQKSF